MRLAGRTWRRVRACVRVSDDERVLMSCLETQSLPHMHSGILCVSRSCVRGWPRACVRRCFMPQYTPYRHLWNSIYYCTDICTLGTFNHFCVQCKFILLAEPLQTAPLKSTFSSFSSCKLFIHYIYACEISCHAPMHALLVNSTSSCTTRTVWH